MVALTGYGSGPYGAGTYATAAVFGSQLSVGFDEPRTTARVVKVGAEAPDHRNRRMT